MGVDSTTFHRVDASCVHIGVAQYISQPRQVLFNTVIRPGKKVAEIVGEYFIRLYPGTLAQRFHITPNVGAVQRLPVPGSKNGTSGLMGFLEIFAQYPPQLFRQKNRAALAFVVDLCVAAPNSVNSYKLQLGDSDSSGTYRLYDKRKAAIA